VASAKPAGSMIGGHYGEPASGPVRFNALLADAGAVREARAPGAREPEALFAAGWSPVPRVMGAVGSLLLDARRGNDGTLVCHAVCGTRHDRSAKVKKAGDRGSRHVQSPTRDQRCASKENRTALQPSLPVAWCVAGQIAGRCSALVVPPRERPRAELGERCACARQSEWEVVQHPASGHRNGARNVG
jgi:hypothetical protein